MAGNNKSKAAAKDLSLQLKKWKQAREEAKQEAKASQKPIFTVRHALQCVSEREASQGGHMRSGEAARGGTIQARTLSAPLQHEYVIP